MASDDHLALASNAKARKMLDQLGVKCPNKQGQYVGEEVKYSERLIKINRKGKAQERVLLITNKAVYNLLPKDYGKCRRRIAIENIAGLTLSTGSNEFALHIPAEYDYRFKSPNKARIAEILASLYSVEMKKKLKIAHSSHQKLDKAVITKDVANLLSREDRLKRWRQLMAERADSGDENDAEDGKAETKNMLDGAAKATAEDFDFLKVIGRGSFGKVMQVRHKGDGQIYAMKILKKKAIIARNQVEHTLAERKILAAMQHPFLMKLRFAFQTEAKLYFVLDYYRGGELFFHLKKRRRFREDEARIFVAEVAMALGHLHKQDIVYRDLKPENILLDHTGHICLTDFGLSKDLDPNNPEAHTFCGTPEYLAPEIVMSKGHGKAVDWWSLGILLYELTVGIPPFYSQNVNEMYRKIQEAPLLFPQSYPSSDCKDLISKLLDRDPEKRMGSGPADSDEIRRHPFFNTLDWDALYRKEIDAIYKPRTQHEADTNCFDKQFTSEPVKDSYVAPTNLAGSDRFQGFTFGGGQAGHLATGAQ